MEVWGLLNRKVYRLSPLEDFPRVDTNLTPKRSDIGSVTHKTAGIDETLQLIDRWNEVARSQRSDLLATKKKERVCANNNSVGVFLGDNREGGFQRTPVISLQD